MRTRSLLVLLSMTLLGAGCQATPSAPETPRPVPAADVNVDQREVRVDLHGRDLRAVPEDVLRRRDVTHLDLSGNALEGSLPAEIRHMRSLRALDASDNRMTGLPAEVGQLRDLRTLDLSGNQLTGLPYELGDLQRLEMLDLTGNPVSEVDLAKITERLPKTTVIKR